ncbi:Phosphatidate cytidylyltransferase [Plasmopara halstedii]|uniref:Phosphatidate cytidylyltransferase n=1 Tax=Plasmopara halstedii TaxID=4781 RepID=A0A0P1ALF6_PLAHL|nr:Phosphatidate cytidylyltransferase [Plasmopara halstedii]CEG41993.1 Phosphatidate cytidylyltransferase [Plasmopara halstedii]|eukprot:XP_024578362.1 Phosphatidate cytidylyltransferase [Plasmopara halstedii]
MLSVANLPSTTNSDGTDDNVATFRPGSSVAMLRPQRASDQLALSWYGGVTSSKRLSSFQLLCVFFHSLLLLGVAIGIVLAAYISVDMERGERRGGALPYILAAFVALAGHEFSWLAYRVHLKLYMPLKLHEKQTSREMYRRIIAYAVDEDTVAVTSLADKCCCRSNIVTAMVLSALGAGLTGLLCNVSGRTQMPVVYVAESTFVGIFSAAMAPNMSTAVCVLIRYMYFFLSSLKVVLRSDDAFTSHESGLVYDHDGELDSRNIMDRHLAVVIEPYSLLLLSVCLLLITRAVTSKDVMESTLMIVLDVAGMLYLSCSAAVLGLFDQSIRVCESGALAGFFVIVWSAELGSSVTVSILKTVQSPWVHPFTKHVSSQQNVEKLLGAVAFAVGAAILVSQYVDFNMHKTFVALLSAGAVMCAHIGKLFLVSLKKIAKVSSTGSYLCVGGGVLDRIDTLLFMALVFAPFFQRAVFNQPQ